MMRWKKWKLKEEKLQKNPQLKTPQMETPPMEIHPIPVTEEDNQWNKKNQKAEKESKGIQNFL